MLIALLSIALVLTCTMFITRNRMLGFPSAIFWVLAGGQAYTLSTVAWGDIEYYIFFASAFGMVIFSAFAAFGLREKKDEYGELSVEGEDEVEKDILDDKFEDELGESKRTKELRERAEERRKKVSKGRGTPWK